jgi:hypothetical protein
MSGTIFSMTVLKRDYITCQKCNSQRPRIQKCHLTIVIMYEAPVVGVIFFFKYLNKIENHMKTNLK